MDLGLSGKVALVCAGSQGLGRAVAIELAREGAYIAVCARNAEPLGRLRTEIAAINSDGCLGVIADVGDPADLDAFVDETTRTWAAPDIVVWNAGGPPPGPLLELGPDALNAGIRLHLQGAMHLFGRVIPAMVERGFGRVIAITSVAVKQPIAGLGISNTVRAGLHGMLKTLALEVGSTGVTVNAVLPGYTRTGRLESLAEARASATGTTPAAVLATFAEEAPAGRLGEPEELAAAVAFLASQRAGFINGVSLPVDGGLIRGLL